MAIVRTVASEPRPGSVRLLDYEPEEPERYSHAARLLALIARAEQGGGSTDEPRAERVLTLPWAERSEETLLPGRCEPPHSEG